MYSFTLYHHKNLVGNIYDFPKRGDGISMHSHPEQMLHNVIVLAGSVDVYGPNKEWSMTLKTGDIVNLEMKHNPHEVAALEPNTRVLGLWTNLSPEMVGNNLEKTGIVETELTIPVQEE